MERPPEEAGQGPRYFAKEQSDEVQADGRYEEGMALVSAAMAG
jgi:hypothetical protein